MLVGYFAFWVCGNCMGMICIAFKTAATQDFSVSIKNESTNNVSTSGASVMFPSAYIFQTVPSLLRYPVPQVLTSPWHVTP